MTFSESGKYLYFIYTKFDKTPGIVEKKNIILIEGIIINFNHLFLI